MCVQLLDAYGYGPYAKVKDLPVKSPEQGIYTKLFSVTNFPAVAQIDESTTWAELPSNNIYINSLADGKKWGNVDPDLGQSFALSYYIFDDETVGYNYDNDGGDDYGQPLESAERDAILSSMDAFANVSGLTFSPGDKTTSNINFAMLDNDDSDGYLGWAYYPGDNPNPPHPASLSTVNADAYNLSGDPNALNPGSYYYLTFTHELGHALGLGHPHDGKVQFPGVPFNDSDNGGNNNLNSTPWTVLSYNDATSTNGLSPNSAANNGFVTNIGAFDIAAAQYLYGPNNSYESGDTTYQLNSNLNGYQTIWDAGGTDIIDASSLSTAVTIDLRGATLNDEVGGGGFESKIDGEYKGYVIAYNSTGNAIIENATGGSGADTLTGNDSANTLNGGGGNDTLQGNGGADIFQMSAGTDVVNDFASGTDKIVVGTGVGYTLTDVGSDLNITASNGNVMLLSGVNKAGFNESTDLVRDSLTHEFTVEYLEGLLGGTADLNGDGDTTDTGTAPDFSGYVDGDDYLVTGTLVGAAALTGAKQALDGFNTTNGITFTKGSYNYANLKGSANNLKGISSDLATVTNLEIIEGIQGGFFPRPAALSDLQTLKTAHQGGGTFTYYGIQGTTKELADSRDDSGFDWIQNITAQNGVKYFTLNDLSLNTTHLSALMGTGDDALTYNGYLISQNGLTSNSTAYSGVVFGATDFAYRSDATPDATTSYLVPVTSSSSPYTNHVIGLANNELPNPSRFADFNVADDDASSGLSLTTHFYGGEQLSHISLSGADLSTTNGYSYQQTAGSGTSSVADDIWTLSLNLTPGQPAISGSVADNSGSSILGLILHTIGSSDVGSTNDLGASVFRTEAWWNDISAHDPNYKFSDICPGININGSNGNAIDFDFYLSKDYLERTFSTDFDAIQGGFAASGLSSVSSANESTGTYIDVSKSGAISSLKLPVTISDVSSTTAGGSTDLYQVAFTNDSWSKGNLSLVYGPSVASTVTGDTSGSGTEDTSAITGTLSATDAQGLADGTIFSIESTDAASNGTATIDASSGAWSYTPDANFNGTDSFTVTITDDLGGTTTQQIDLTITAVDDPAVISGDTSGSGTEDTSAITGTLSATDTEGLTDGTIFSIESTDAASNGTATIDASSGAWSYTPDANFNGTDSFTVTITDDLGGTTTQQIDLTITEAPTPTPTPTPTPSPAPAPSPSPTPAPAPAPSPTPAPAPGPSPTPAPLPTPEPTPTPPPTPSPVDELPADVSDLSADDLATLSPDAVGDLTSDQVSDLNPSALQGFTADQVAELSGDAVAAFTPQQVEQLSAEAVAGLSKSQVSELSPKAVKGFSADQMEQMPKRSFKALETVQLAKLRKDAVTGLTRSQLKTLSGDELSAFKPGKIKAISAESISGLKPAALDDLSKKQVKAFTDAQLAGLSKKQIKKADDFIDALSDQQREALVKDPGRSSRLIEPFDFAMQSTIDVFQDPLI